MWQARPYFPSQTVLDPVCYCFAPQLGLVKRLYTDLAASRTTEQEFTYASHILPHWLAPTLVRLA